MDSLDSLIACKKRLPRLLQESVDSKDALAVTFVNPFSYYILKGRSDLVDYFDYIFIDGLLLEVLHNRFHDNRVQRASFDFSSIANDVFEHCIINGLKVSLIGAKEEENKKAVKNIKSIFPKLNICSSRNGYFYGTELCDYLFQIKSLNPDVIIVGAGTPIQEEIILKAKKMKIGKLLFTCGGFLTQTSMKTEYYHPLIKKLDLRWLQRAFLHKHVRRRLLINYPRFLVKYLLERLYFNE
jgi:N-acetylglucosaminyldiphosphoundecaprenol N-acetyl-beta-D-mannosaminyltransferase